MNGNNRPKSNGEVDSALQKQVKEVADQLQKEIKRLRANLAGSEGNPQLYQTMAKQIILISEETVHHDVISALRTASDNLKKAEAEAKSHTSNKEIISHLQTANAELSKSKNIRG